MAAAEEKMPCALSEQGRHRGLLSFSREARRPESVSSCDSKMFREEQKITSEPKALAQQL
jgi:hypothetical protein